MLSDCHKTSLARTVVSDLGLVLLALLPFTGFTAVQAQTTPVLSHVNKIYVERLGHGKLGDQIRDRVIARLRKKSHLEVVGVPDQADAIMGGTAEVWVTGYVSASPHSSSMLRQAVYSGFLSARITGKNNEVLWSYLVTPSKFAWGGIINDLADNLVSSLLEARNETNGAGPATPPAGSALISLHGAGATFPAPLYQKWFESIEKQQPNESIAYEGVGSEDGIEMLNQGKVDFAASDMPVSDERMSRKGTSLEHFASVLGAVVPVYNLANVMRPLNFTGEILAGIYLGKIKRWNDAKIRAANRGVKLPDREITVIHRADGSGTTFVWSDFLSKVSPEWKSSVGSSTILQWPVGTGVERNEGVAVMVQNTSNSIGYVEMAYALQHRLSFGAVQNPAGVFVRADLSSVKAAAAAANLTDDLRISITNVPGAGAYPIASFTWLLFPKDIADPTRKNALYQLIEWILTSGQKQCSELGYTPLPQQVVSQELAILRAQK